MCTLGIQVKGHRRQKNETLDRLLPVGADANNGHAVVEDSDKEASYHRPDNRTDAH